MDFVDIVSLLFSGLLVVVIAFQAKLMSNQNKITDRQTKLSELDKLPYVFIIGGWTVLGEKEGEFDEFRRKIHNYSRYPVKINSIFIDGKSFHKLQGEVIPPDGEIDGLNYDGKSTEIKIEVETLTIEKILMKHVFDAKTLKLKKSPDIEIVKDS